MAETCGPFTCIPAILNEYRTSELSVRTGCLKALTFIFQYVGPQSVFYCDSVVSMLEDALTDRDLVHRQTASTVVKHLALGVAGLGSEDIMIHLLNLIWPNCFETSPHVIGAVVDAMKWKSKISDMGDGSKLCTCFLAHCFYDQLDLVGAGQREQPIGPNIVGPVGQLVTYRMLCVRQTNRSFMAGRARTCKRPPCVV